MTSTFLLQGHCSHHTSTMSGYLDINCLSSASSKVSQKSTNMTLKQCAVAIPLIYAMQITKHVHKLAKNIKHYNQEIKEKQHVPVQKTSVICRVGKKAAIYSVRGGGKSCILRGLMLRIKKFLAFYIYSKYGLQVRINSRLRAAYAQFITTSSAIVITML